MNPLRMQNTPSTGELVRRAQDGEREAIDALFAKSYADVLQAVRFRIGPALRRRMDTADVAQSAYHEAYRDLAGYEYHGKGSFRRWLMGIVEHKIRGRLQFFRAQRRDMRRDVSLDSNAQIPGPSQSPGRRLLHMEDRQRLEAAMDRLPGGDREVIINRFYLHLPWKKIGERQGGRTPEAAQMKCRRALYKLKTFYEDSGG